MQNRKGFKIAISIVLVCTVGFSVWYVWHTQNSQTTKVKDQKATTLQLASDKVAFDLPQGWKVSSKELSPMCSRVPAGEIECLESVRIVPDNLDDSANIKYQGVKISVYKAEKTNNARDWYNIEYQNAIDEGTFSDKPNLPIVASGRVSEFSTNPISGNDAYYLKHDSNGRVAVHYSLLSKGLAVLIYSELKNTESADGTARINDFTNFFEDVKSIAQSVVIK